MPHTHLFCSRLQVTALVLASLFLSQLLTGCESQVSDWTGVLPAESANDAVSPTPTPDPVFGWQEFPPTLTTPGADLPLSAA